MGWFGVIFEHPTRGTCTKGCDLYGVCHCGCNAPTNLAIWNHAPQHTVKDEPYLYLPHHKRKDRMAECHPDKLHRAKGLCQQCYESQIYRRRKLGMGIERDWIDWERRRYNRFIELTSRGMRAPGAMRLLDSEIPAAP